MRSHSVVSQAEWLAARKQLLAREKEFTKARDALSAARRALPWTEVTKDYRFVGPQGPVGLADLFGGRSQLLLYHFMFDPEWEVGCKSCSFWADHFDSLRIHLPARDAELAAVSRAPLAKIEAFRRRMQWRFPWFSSEGSDFNYDFGVSFSDAEVAAKTAQYNFGCNRPMGREMPGVSVFRREADGRLYRTYSCYARGLDMLNGTYQLLDLLPKGRDEADLSFPMAWVRLKDQYAAAGR